jgi:hypothetical protein
MTHFLVRKRRGTATRCPRRRATGSCSPGFQRKLPEPPWNQSRRRSRGAWAVALRICRSPGHEAPNYIVGSSFGVIQFRDWWWSTVVIGIFDGRVDDSLNLSVPHNAKNVEIRQWMDRLQLSDHKDRSSPGKLPVASPRSAPLCQGASGLYLDCAPAAVDLRMPSATEHD